MPPELRAISPDATREEVAAIVAALAATRSRLAAPSEAQSPPRWVAASRLSARGSGLARGEWRLSGRIARRSRA